MTTLDTIRELMGEPPAPPPAPTDPPQGSPAQQPPPMSEYKRAFRLAFDFLQQHTPANKSVEYWAQASSDIAAASAQGGNHPFLQDILDAVFKELERQARAQDAQS